jgi:hypothetical protein
MFIVFPPVSGHLIHEEMLERGYARFKDRDSGKLILLIQGQENGVIPLLEQALRGKPELVWPDLVICCYAHWAAYLYPDLHFADPGFPVGVEIHFTHGAIGVVPVQEDNRGSSSSAVGG